MTDEPLWLQVARAHVGVKEVPGPKSNPTILGWARKVGRKAGIAYTDDSIPWCGLFMAYVMQAAGFTPPDIAVRARAWAAWGQPCEPQLGAVLVFGRKGGGHVCWYLGENKIAFQVLGANQNDSVNVTWIAKDRLVASRWPPGATLPARPVRVIGAQGPAALSTNEA